jgi:predicted DsbA family dithiol-disulfide isomerase
MEDHRHRSRIEVDIQQARKCGVQHAPTLFINDLLYSGPLEYDELVNALSEVSGL